MSNILVVDDDISTRILITEVIRDTGIHIFEAGSGKETIKIFNQQKNKLSLVLLDIYLPDCTGFDVIKQIKNIDQTVPVVAISAVTINEIERKCKRFGFVDFISKPFNLDKIRLTVSTYCERKPAFPGILSKR
jgi:CheY-like chemotaxis protein